MRTGRRVSPAALVAAAAALLSFVDGAVNLTNVTPIEKGCKGPQDGIDGKGTANAVVCQACGKSKLILVGSNGKHALWPNWASGSTCECPYEFEN